MLTNEQTSSWKYAMKSIQQMEERKCSRTNKLLAEKKAFSKMEERKCSRTNKLLTEKSNEIHSREKEKARRTSF